MASKMAGRAGVVSWHSELWHEMCVNDLKGVLFNSHLSKSLCLTITSAPVGAVPLLRQSYPWRLCSITGQCSKHSGNGARISRVTSVLPVTSLSLTLCSRINARRRQVAHFKLQCSIDVWDLDLPSLQTLIPLLRRFVTCSKESGWDHVTCG